MSYCLNPACPSPQNADDSVLCQCGAKLRLNNRYLAIRSIGQGGFGRTFLAVDLSQSSKPRCVIKQFFSNWGIDRTKAAILFREEAARLKQVDAHPQIPDLLDSLEQDGHQYLIQEFIDGQNLEQELSDRGAFDESQIDQLLKDLLPVLQFMHDRQIIHRDIKPANMIRRAIDQKLVLVDMGAAKFSTGTAFAKTGTVIGSAEYTAPEQTRGKAVYASDLYSLGATCIHLLTEMSPFDLFDGSDDRWIWRDYLDQPVSNSLAQVIDRMLQSATNRRYRSANEVLADLKQTEKAQLSEPAIAPTSRSPETQLPVIEVAQAKTTATHPNISFEKGGEAVAVDRAAEELLQKRERDQKAATRLLWLFCVLALVSIPSTISALFPSIPASLRSLSAKQLQPITQLRDRSTHTLISSGTNNSIAASADNRTIATTSYHQDLSNGQVTYEIEVWNLETEEQIVKPLPGQERESIAISPDGKILVSFGGIVASSEPQAIKIWSLETGELIHQIEVDGWYRMAAISPDGQTLIAASGNSIAQWDLRTGDQIRTFPPTANQIDSIAISPDGKTLISTEDSGSLMRVWDLQTGTVLRSWQSDPVSGQTPYPEQTVITSDRLVVTVGEINQILNAWITTVWNLDTGEQIRKLDLGSPINDIAVGRNGILATYGIGEPIELWDVHSGKRIRVLPAPGSSIDSMIFSPNGKNLIVSSSGVIKVLPID